MSNGYKLELSRWGDREVHLVFWDCFSTVGDHNYVLKEDGEVYRVEYTEDDEEILTKVDLGIELIGLEKQLYEEENDQETD